MTEPGYVSGVTEEAEPPEYSASATVFSLDALAAGFDDHTRQSQAVFRQVLGAMAEPGKVHRLARMQAPQPLSSAAYQVCLALLDQETPLWLSDSLSEFAGLKNSVRFHCGCAVTGQPTGAAFGLALVQDSLSLKAFEQGTYEYPDRSATVIVEVDGFQDGQMLVLEGPGVRGTRTVMIDGFSDCWATELAVNGQRFPCGVDLIFTSGIEVMALPRTTRVRTGNQENTPCTSQ